MAHGILFVTCTARKVVAALDPTKGTLVDRIPVGAEPHELAVASNRLYVGSRRDGESSVIDANRRKRIGQLVADGKARIEGIETAVAADRGYAVDRAGQWLLAFSLESGPTLLGEASVGADPYELAVFEDAILVPGPGSGVVHEFSPDLRHGAVHHGFEQPVDVVEYEGERWVIDRSAAVLRSLSGREIDLPAGVMAAQPTPVGLILSHYDDAAISLVTLDDGVRWTHSTGEYPLGTVSI